MEFGVVSRPYPGYLENGDAYSIRPRDDHRVLVALVDGLGHGPEAAEAAQIAIDYLSSSAQEDLPGLLRGCSIRLRGTRGAVVALAEIDEVARQLRYCGAGNIEARLIGRITVRPVSYNGVVGAVMPHVRVFEFPFGPGDLLLLHTDGISARFDLSQYPDLAGQPAQLIAEAIARDWSRPYDDATIIVARHTGGSR